MKTRIFKIFLFLTFFTCLNFVNMLYLSVFYCIIDFRIKENIKNNTPLHLYNKVENAPFGPLLPEWGKTTLICWDSSDLHF